MMKVYLSIFLIAIVVLKEANSEEIHRHHRHCGEREKYNECGTACPTTCENYRRRSQVCTMNCVKGCFCISPYIRDSNGHCVHPSECKHKPIEPEEPICKARNETYKRCGSLCPRTCANRGTTPICASVCRAGCFCNPGYLRNSHDVCVLERDCS